MHSFNTFDSSRFVKNGKRFAWLMVLACCLGMPTAFGQETDFSPFARYGFGTWQHAMTPGLAAMGGTTTVTGSSSLINPDQPASVAAVANPTFQSSFFSQAVRLREGIAEAQATTGGLGNLGLIVKRPQRLSGFSLGLTPLTSKAFSVRRTTTDPLLGDVTEYYDGSGGMARAYSGLARGWRLKQWRKAGAQDSVLITTHGMYLGAQFDYWFGDAIQTSFLDIEDVNYRDVRSQISNRHRSAGLTVGAETFHTLISRFKNKQFLGSLTLKTGVTWSPSRTLLTDYSEVTQSTVTVSGVVAPVDSSFSETSQKQGEVPGKWSAGAGLIWNGKTGARWEMYVDHHRQAWAASADTLAYLMDAQSSWADATRSAVGLAWTPGRKSGKVNRTTWRTGVNWSTLPVTLEGTDGDAVPLNEWRVAMGFSTPLKGSRSASQLHFGMDVGRRGTMDETMHEEFGARLHLGWSMTPFVKNLWLTPRLYD